MLRERGAEFGLAERPNLQRVLADPRPERVVAGMVALSEARSGRSSRSWPGSRAEAAEARARRSGRAAVRRPRM